MDIPEWATDVLRFENGTVVYYNEELWESMEDGERVWGEWANAEELGGYLAWIEDNHVYTHETINISLENK